MLNLIKEQDDDCLIDKIYLYAKELNERKYQFLIKKCESRRIKHSNNLKAFIEFSNNLTDIYDNTDDYNLTSKRRNFLCLMIWFWVLWLIKTFKP